MGSRFRYDEWDEKSGSYKRDFVQVVEAKIDRASDNDYVSGVLAKEGDVIRAIVRDLEMLKPEEFQTVRKQVSGEVDYDALVRARAEMGAGITPSDKIYTRRYKNERSVASLVVSEASGSLRKFLDLKNPGLRILDVIKHSQIYFCEALEKLGDSYALAVFSGETEKNVEFFMLKGFNSSYDDETRKVIGSLLPMKQNRDGAGIRHAAYILRQQPEKIKLLYYLMEGVPHDFGYEGRHAIEDTKKAIIEAKMWGCVPVVLAYGNNIDKEIASISLHAIYREIPEPLSVPQVLLDLHRRLTL
jgi:nitric oxide reductase NorD protein